MAKKSACEKYGYLDRLSTEQLEELLRADFESDEEKEGILPDNSLIQKWLGKSFSNTTTFQRGTACSYILVIKLPRQRQNLL